MASPARAISMMLVLTLAGCPRTREREASEPGETTNADEAAERRAIEASVNGYVDSLVARDPASASGWVTSSSFAFYEQLRQLALTGTRKQVEALGIMAIIMTLELRARFTRSELEQTTGRALFEDAIAKGMPAQPFELADVRIDHEHASAEVWVGDQPVVWLEREQGRWLVDLPAMIDGLAPLIEAEFADAILADGKLRVAFSLLEIQRESGAGLDLAILDGPLDAEPTSPP
ncbi:hypothetical protein ACNOYE_15545 [Nannocystaceae bacterium ST9]